jgi:hypothetical protein
MKGKESTSWKGLICCNVTRYSLPISNSAKVTAAAAAAAAEVAEVAAEVERLSDVELVLDLCR